ncbi:MAG TPA: rod shape-determining protein MreC [Pirellulales bacterium]|nr:rod shape-determining protein MreC [Pirellulales bacterium]
MMFESSERPKPLLTRPRLILAGSLAAGLITALLPARALEPLRALYNRALEPGQLVAGRLVARLETLVAQARHATATADEVAGLTADAARLRARNQELETALALAQASAAQSEAASHLPATPPLVLTEAIRARVLGRRAGGLFPESEIVAVGSTSGVRREALALRDSTVTVDAGHDVQVVAGDFVLAGRRIYGKVLEVAPHTCVVRGADQASYRDVVQLVKLVDGRANVGPTGILEGTGDGRCRVRMINASEDVSVGDLVFTAHDEGLTTQPLLYGPIARCERAPGAPHWDLWVDLQREHHRPSHLVVLRASLNPARVAALPASQSEQE